MNFFLDGFTIGSAPFGATATNKLGGIRLIYQGSNPLTSSLYVDNLSVTAGTVVSTGLYSLQITSAGPCLPSGSLGIPQVGESYGLSVTASANGTPSQPFRLRWSMASITNYSGYVYSMGTGSGYTWHLPLTEPLYRTAVPLDDLIPWSVTLDPDGLSGNTNLAGATISGTFAPIPPTTAVQLYAPRMMHGFETYSLSYSNATVSNLGVLFGVPTTHGAQTVVSVSSPVGGQVTNTPPFGIPLCVASGPTRRREFIRTPIISPCN